MKKTLRNILSLISVFLLILVMMPSKTFVVHAAEESEEQEFKIVAYGGVVLNSNGFYSGVYAVKQALFKVPSAYSNTSSGPSQLTGAADLTPSNMASSDSMKWAKSDSDFNVFDGSKMKAELAYFTMDSGGNVTISLQNEVKVERLNFYYIIAGNTSHVNSPTSMIMCGSSICQHARNIISADTTKTGSWQTSGKSGIMSYNEGSLTAIGFEKQVNTTGAVKYSGFNVIENMSEGNKRSAVSLGAFVVITMSIRNLSEPEGMNNDNVYYVNSTLPSNMTFDRITQNDSGSTKVFGNIYSNAKQNTSESFYNEKNNAIGKNVDRFAALVHNLPVSSTNAGMEKLLEQFDSYVKPVIEIGLGVLLVVRGTMLIVAIIKASDEPDVRRDNIKHLVTLFITVLLIMVIIWFMKDIINIIADFIIGM